MTAGVVDEVDADKAADMDSSTMIFAYTYWNIVIVIVENISLKCSWLILVITI